MNTATKGHDMMLKEAPYVLPYGRGYDKWNPMEPAAHAFGPNYMRNMSAIVLKRIDKPRKAEATRVVVGYGAIDPEWTIGNVWRLRHDQTNALLGDYEVVGEVNYAEGPDGEAVVTSHRGVTNLRLPVSTFK
jgi:hypothetical protein